MSKAANTNQQQPNVVTSIAREYNQKSENKIPEFEHLKDELRKIKVTRPTSGADNDGAKTGNVSLRKILDDKSPTLIPSKLRNEPAKGSFRTIN
jgi:hypothetical protein